MQRSYDIASRTSIDAATSRAVCEGVGERLRDTFKKEDTSLPPRLRELLMRIERQDNTASR